MWIGLEGDEIVIGHLMRGRKLTNVLADPRVVLTIEVPGSNPVGMTNYLIVHGTARKRVVRRSCCNVSLMSTSDPT